MRDNDLYGDCDFKSGLCNKALNKTGKPLRVCAVPESHHIDISNIKCVTTFSCRSARLVFKTDDMRDAHQIGFQISDNKFSFAMAPRSNATK